jgi:hypothetical protein
MRIMSRPFQKNYAAHIEGSYEEHRMMDKTIAAIQNVYNMSRWDAISYLFKLGAEMGLKYVQDEAERQDAKAVLVKSKLLDIIRAESRHDDEIRKGVGELGVERVVSAARVGGLNEDSVRAVLEEIRVRAPYKETAAYWLDSYLSDYRSRSTIEVKKDAIKDGILPKEDDPSFDNQWATMRSVASRLGFTRGTERGEWQKRLL